MKIGNNRSGIRYATQRDSYSCGPVAILNLLKWIGIKASLKNSLKPISDVLGTNTEPKGTDPIRLWNFLVDLNNANLVKLIGRKTNPSLAWIDNHLRKGRAIILSYQFQVEDEETGHYILCIGKKKCRYIIINDTVKDQLNSSLVAVSYQSPKLLEKKLRRRYITHLGVNYYSAGMVVEKI